MVINKTPINGIMIASNGKLASLLLDDDEMKAEWLFCELLDDKCEDELEELSDAEVFDGEVDNELEEDASGILLDEELLDDEGEGELEDGELEDELEEGELEDELEEGELEDELIIVVLVVKIWPYIPSPLPS